MEKGTGSLKFYSVIHVHVPVCCTGIMLTLNHTHTCICSGSDVYDRVSTFLETMYRDMEKGGCGQNTIIVSHGLFCRLFLTRYYHWSVSILPACVTIATVLSWSLPPSPLNRSRNFIKFGTLKTVSLLSWSCNPVVDMY